MRALSAPGSVVWLLGHDVRLACRDLRVGLRGLGPRKLIGLAVLLGIVLHLAAWPIAAEFARRSLAAPDDPRAMVEAAALTAFVLLLMLAQSLNGVTKLLYSRGDLDLLLSAPLPPGRVFLVRSLSVALGAMTSAAIFVVPLADAGLMAGDPRFLALYPALLGAALLCASVAILAALVLFRLLGPKATRLAAQILATVLGAGFMLTVQLQTLLPAVSPSGVLDSIRRLPFGMDRLMLLPVEAGLGRPLPLVAWLVMSAGLFGLVAGLLGGRLAGSAQAAASVDWSPRPRLRSSSRNQVFRPARSVSAALRRKERQLVLRDPWIVSQVLLQVLYMTPMAVLLWSGAGSAVLALAPMVVVIAFQVGSSLTWLGLSGEDAPELLATAPVPARVLRWGKLQAVAGLTSAVIGLPLAWLAMLAPARALAACGLALLAVGSAVLLQLWQGRPGRRARFAARHRESKLVAMIEMGLSVLWGISTALLMVPSPWASLPLGAVAIVLLCCRSAPTPTRTGV